MAGVHPPPFARSLSWSVRVAVVTASLAVSCQSASPDPAALATAGASNSKGGSVSGASTGGAGVPAGGSASAGASTGGNVPVFGGTNSAGGDVAGSSSGGSGSAGSAGAASSDYCAGRAGLTFCETFEALPAGATVASASWTPAINGDGEVVIDDQVAHGGAHSLKVHGSGFSTFLVLSGGGFPPTTGPLHVRLFMRLAEAMTGGHNTFLVADTQAAPGAGNSFRLGEMNAMLMYTVNGDTHGALANENYYNDHLPGAALGPLTWSCLELVLDHQKPEVAVTLDGKSVTDLHHVDWALDAYDTLRFGFEKYAGPVGDVWYDDIAVGTTSLGCN